MCNKLQPSITKEEASRFLGWGSHYFAGVPWSVVSASRGRRPHHFGWFWFIVSAPREWVLTSKNTPPKPTTLDHFGGRLSPWWVNRKGNGECHKKVLMEKRFAHVAGPSLHDEDGDAMAINKSGMKRHTEKWRPFWPCISCTLLHMPSQKRGGSLIISSRGWGWGDVREAFFGGVLSHTLFLTL